MNDAELRQPDIFERSQAQATELAILGGKIGEACWAYEAARVRKNFAAMRSAAIDLQTYRTQFTAMVASIERVIEKGV